MVYTVHLLSARNFWQHIIRLACQEKCDCHDDRCPTFPTDHQLQELKFADLIADCIEACLYETEAEEGGQILHINDGDTLFKRHYIDLVDERYRHEERRRRGKIKRICGQHVEIWAEVLDRHI